MSVKEARKANSFTKSEVVLACSLMNDMLAGSKVSKLVLRRPEFESLFRKFAKMKQSMDRT